MRHVKQRLVNIRCARFNPVFPDDLVLCVTDHADNVRHQSINVFCALFNGNLGNTDTQGFTEILALVLSLSNQAHQSLPIEGLGIFGQRVENMVGTDRHNELSDDG